MSLTKFSRQIIDLIIIELPYCSLKFNNPPCNASGSKCFNTYFTCKAKTRYTATTKQYKYVSHDSNGLVIDALPYIQNIDYIPAEIRDDKTINARATITFIDERDYDVNIDKYYAERPEFVSSKDIMQIPGYHFKKLIERNPNYRSGILKHYQGTEDQTEDQYTLIDTLKMENINLSSPGAVLEAIDLFAELQEEEYPIRLNAQISEDMGAFHECKDEESMLKLTPEVGDYALRTDFLPIIGTAVVGVTGGTLGTGTYGYRVVGYNSSGRAVAAVDLLALVLTGSTNKVTLSWQTQNSVVSYKIFYRTFDLINNIYDFEYAYETVSLTFVDTGAAGTAGGLAPTKAERVYQYSGGSASSINNWALYSSILNVQISDVSDLDASGYFLVEDEIAGYGDIYNSFARYLKRNQYETKTSRHLSGTNIYKILQFAPGNPFTYALEILRLRYDDTFIDVTTWEAYAAAYTGINVSLKPVTKKTKLSAIFFDLMMIIDATAWRNKSGKITVKLNTENSTVATFTDEDNILLNSISTDLNESDRINVITVFWDRYDLTQALNDEKNYNYSIEYPYEDASSANFYNDEIEKKIYTAWINADCGTLENIYAYLNTVFIRKLMRSVNARKIFNLETDIKDNAIKLGDIILLNTSAANNIDGTDYSGKKFEVIEKDPQGSRIKFKIRYYPEETISVTPKNFSIRKETLTPTVNDEIGYEMKVSGLQFYNNTGEWQDAAVNLDLDKYDSIRFRWDNNRARTENNVELNDGTDLMVSNASKFFLETKEYRVYMGVIKVPTTSIIPQKKYPTEADTNCDYELIKRIPDLQSSDPNYKYEFEYFFNKQNLGDFVVFFISAVTNPGIPISVARIR